MDKRNNIFISHHGKDDDKLQSLKDRLCSAGYDVHNYSVDSTKHKDGRRPTDAVIARYLRMQVKWSGTFICLVGEETHTRKWVNEEIKMAHEQGKRIIGVYAHGHMDAQLPDALKMYANNMFGWNSIDKIGEAIEGEPLPFENPNGTPSAPLFNVTRVKC
jgi:hypothetical protein